MKKSDMQRILRRQGALLLAVLLTFQNGFAAWGSVSREEVQAAEPSSENTSFVSFPSRFEDELPEGYEEQYYFFSLESRGDRTAAVTLEDRSSPYGAELLDSSLSRLGISKKRNGQRIVKKQLPAGTYFLRVFSMSEQQESQPFTVSIQKMDLSASAVRGTDFSELHMVAALQGTDSPAQMN